jgi:hypothetical protein
VAPGVRVTARELLGSVTGRSAFTWSPVTDAAPLPQAERTKVNTWAISSSLVRIADVTASLTSRPG